MLPGMAPVLVGEAAAGGGGSGGAAAQLFSETYEQVVSFPGTANVIFTLGDDGHVVATGGAAYDWMLSGVSSDYEVSFDAGGSWLSLATGRSLSKARSLKGVTSQTYSVKIRNAVSHVEIAAASITLRAEVEP